MILSKNKRNHYPNLNTVIMVERTLQRASQGTISVPQLKRMLPRQVNHNTLLLILEYLEYSNKILVGLKGITWIHNTNSNLKKEIEKGFEI